MNNDSDALLLISIDAKLSKIDGNIASIEKRLNKQETSITVIQSILTERCDYEAQRILDLENDRLDRDKRLRDLEYQRNREIGQAGITGGIFGGVVGFAVGNINGIIAFFKNLFNS